MALLPLLGAGPMAHAQVDERAMKAAYLYNFIQFAQWPVAPDEPFRLCVLGQTPLDAQLEKLAGKTVLNGLHIAVVHVTAQDALGKCHALYLDDSQRRWLPELLPRLEQAPILTITDGDGLAEQGLKPLGDDARRDVDVAARREGRNNAHGTRGPGLRRR